MGKRLAIHRSRIRWINSCWEDFDGINEPLKWSEWATLKGYRKHLHKKQKTDRLEKRELSNLRSTSEYRLRKIRYRKTWKKKDEAEQSEGNVHYVW